MPQPRTSFRLPLGRLVAAPALAALAACQGPAAPGARSGEAPPTRRALVVPLVAKGSTWRFQDGRTPPPAGWRAPTFDDAGWRSGPAKLGYGDGNEATVVPFGPDPQAKPITAYFRRSFQVGDPSGWTALRLSLLRDDGAVVYLNGAEVARSNLPGGAIAPSTRATSAVNGADEGAFVDVPIAPSALVRGQNVLAVEVHQVEPDSTDLGFDLALEATDDVSITRGPYLQLGTPTSAVVRWRTSVPTPSRVRIGASPGALTRIVDEAPPTTEHEVEVTGLAPATKYVYAVGTPAAQLAGGDAAHAFVTPPAPGATGPMRIWVLGDSGTANAGALAVRDAYRALAAERRTDVWLMLGDNAYPAGTDAEYQRAVFDVYPDLLRGTFLWPTIGNHDTAQASAVDDALPYFKMFTLPTKGEAGGVPSGTEKYYAFDHGNVHFVCLDSMASSRAAGGAMLTWLKADLAANARDWLVAFFHHPPYTKGSHDSDSEAELVEMRQNALPILEAHGVDLVLTGHSHNYERSFLVDGHYGPSGSFTAAMKKNGGSGRPGQAGGGGAYAKPTRGPGAREGAVYVVAGSGGQVTLGTKLDHPAMFLSLHRLGSLVVDVDGARLDARFLRETGAVDDSFTIVKGPQTNALPTVALTAPAPGASFVAPAEIALAATASDPDGAVTQVTFLAGGVEIGTDASAPFELAFRAVPAGTHQIVARATDDRGGTSTSAPLAVAVREPPPAPPAGLAATAAGPSQIDLAWTAPAGVTGFSIERSADGTTFQPMAMTGPETTRYAVTGLEPATSYHFRVSALGPGGASAPSSPASARTAAAVVCVAEICDGADNDCDGAIDESFPDKGAACSAGTGACARPGVRTCAPGGLGTVCGATAGAPAAELCDGIDNDCQGDVDEEFPDRGAPCTVGTGACLRAGTRICAPTLTATVCSAAPGAPAPELCDGLDNDCDDVVDEGCGPDAGAPEAGVDAAGPGPDAGIVLVVAPPGVGVDAGPDASTAPAPDAAPGAGPDAEPPTSGAEAGAAPGPAPGDGPDAGIDGRAAPPDAGPRPGDDARAPGGAPADAAPALDGGPHRGPDAAAIADAGAPGAPDGAADEARTDAGGAARTGDGCGCDLGGRSSTPPAGLPLALGAAGLALLVRRRAGRGRHPRA